MNKITAIFICIVVLIISVITALVVIPTKKEAGPLTMVQSADNIIENSKIINTFTADGVGL